ncbi:hypothetical protein [Streptomyces sp. NPDC093261]|uniref:hypothetical protein n=1 Tax=Streptomyces sp. NPDC093261 TaxID=3366037 RepID=UPI003813AA52
MVEMAGIGKAVLALHATLRGAPRLAGIHRALPIASSLIKSEDRSSAVDTVLQAPRVIPAESRRCDCLVLRDASGVSVALHTSEQAVYCGA